MPKPLCALFLACVFGAAVHSQSAQSTNGFITGRVTERLTGQPVMARVSIAGKTETQCDDRGNFILQIAPGIYSLVISFNGFATVVINQVAITGKRNTVVDVQLDISLRENVEVRSEIFSENSEQSVSNTTVRREDLRLTPGTGGDPLRAINSLPAVTAASGEFADLIVRGGTAEENLTYIDSIPVRDFTYFTDQYDGTRGGRAGILAPDVFDRAEFSAGGFGPRYGDRMSSVLDISLREANRRKVQAVLFGDSGTAGGSLDIPFGPRGGWLVSARRSYLDVALDVAGITEQGTIGYPRTFDVTNKFVYDLTPRNKLTFSALNFFESLNQSDEQAVNMGRRTDRLRLRRRSQRHVFGATLSSTLGRKTLARTTAWMHTNHNDGTFFLPFTPILQRSRNLQDLQFGFKEDVTVAWSSRTHFSFGGGLYIDRANYHTFENKGDQYSPLEEEFLARARENRLVLANKASGYVYAQGTLNLTRRFSITPGARLDHYALTGETLASPRFGARLNVGSGVAMTFAAGIYRQPPGLFVFSLTPNNQGLKTQKASHLIAGVEWLPRDDTRVRLEAYQKTYDDLIVQPAGATPGFVSDGNYFNSGRASSRGFEISMQKSLTGFFSGQASYGFIRSRRRLTPGGNVFPSDFERPHQLTLIGITRFSGFSVAAKYRIASGLPDTRRTPIQPVPGSGALVHRIQMAGDINALRLPAFASLDVRVEKRFQFKRWSFSPYIDIFNITNHRSLVQPNYEFYSPTPFFLSEDKRLPIFGFRLEF